MRISRASLGQASVNSASAFAATAGPTMPANVAAANNIITQQPENNLIIQLAQQLGGGVYPISSIPGQMAGMVAQYKAIPASDQQVMIQPLLALWSFLPTYLANAPTVDAWGSQNGVGGNWTAMGQYVQAYLQQLFPALGVTPPAQSGSGGSSSGSLPSYAIPLGIAAVGLLVWMVVER
jgi:hypothetical protein